MKDASTRRNIGRCPSFAPVHGSKGRREGKKRGRHYPLDEPELGKDGSEEGLDALFPTWRDVSSSRRPLTAREKREGGEALARFSACSITLGNRKKGKKKEKRKRSHNSPALTQTSWTAETRKFIGLYHRLA